MQGVRSKKRTVLHPDTNLHCFNHLSFSMSWSISSMLLILTTGLCLSSHLLRKTHPLTKLAFAYGVYQLVRLDQAVHQAVADTLKEAHNPTLSAGLRDCVEEKYAPDQATAEANNIITRPPESSCEICQILDAPSPRPASAEDLSEQDSKKASPT